jgi:transcriptional regulator with XRE-family HTH domain
MSRRTGNTEAEPAPQLHLSDRLETARKDRGLTQAQAARELDVARSAYRLWEMGAALPAPKRWQPVATWLGVTVMTLLLAEGLISDDEGLAVGGPGSVPAPQAGE